MINVKLVVYIMATGFQRVRKLCNLMCVWNIVFLIIRHLRQLIFINYTNTDLYHTNIRSSDKQMSPVNFTTIK